jgi:tRNA dimethylallyltransferase
MLNNLIVLLGPTGVGKTDIAVEIASIYGCEIISCDSRQFYREMSIGTAVPSEAQLNRAKHHFIKFLSIKDYYSACRFETDVINILPQLFAKNNLVMMAGGSAMYIEAVCKGYDDIPDVDPVIRDKYISLYKKEGIESLRMALKILDPEHYSKVDLKNHKRIIRALEICDSSGKPYSAFLKNQRKSRDFRIIRIGLNRPRKELYDLINIRVDKMLADGLEEEARSLYEFRHLNALNTVGYKELFDYFDGSISYEKAIELIKRNSRRFAKRQLTWWARDEEIRWFHPVEAAEIIEYIRGEINKS